MKRILSIGSLEAKLAVDAIYGEAEARGLAAVIAVADAYGELLSLVRMDNALLVSSKIAANKAWTAARDRRRTEEIGKAARDPVGGFDMAFYSDPRYVGWAGGVPVFQHGQVVGAVAVSGLSEAQDAELAQVGVDAIRTCIERSSCEQPL